MKKLLVSSFVLVLVGVLALAPMASAHDESLDHAGGEFLFAELGVLALGTIGQLALQSAEQNTPDRHELYLAESLWHLSRAAGAGLGATLYGQQQGVNGNSLLAYGLAATYLLAPTSVNHFFCQPLEARVAIEDGATPLDFEQVTSENNSLLCQTARAANELAIYAPLIPVLLATLGYNLGTDL